MGEKIDRILLSTMGWLPARLSLAVICWFGFMNLYMVRINLSVILLAMVRRNTSTSTLAPCQMLLNDTYDNDTQEFSGEEDPTASVLRNEEGEMEWTEATQGYVLAAFSYGYTLSQIIGGRVAELYGTRPVLGGCILTGGICSLLSPVVARTHYGAFIALRIIVGIGQGVCWPSMHACTVRWIPPLERPRFVSIVYFAGTLSAALTLPLCGVIISAHGWDTAFYVTGALSLIWCVFWFSLMHETPREHPRISREELEYIEDALQGSVNANRKIKLPLRSILTSLPCWAIVVGDLGNSWGLALFMFQLPTYLKNILGFSIKENGVLSALPFLLRYAGAMVWSTLGDWLVKREYISVWTSRRIFGAVALWGPTLMILGVVFSGCNTERIITLLCVSMFLNGAVTTSLIVNHTDISPNFAGTILGINNTTSSMIFFVVPMVVGALTDGQQTSGQWQTVFLICVPMYAVTGVFYLVFGSGSIQPWNNVAEEAPNSDLKKVDDGEPNESSRLKQASE